MHHENEERSAATAIGQPVDRVDGRPLVEGRARYAADYTLPDALYGAVLLAPHPCARIRSLETREAAGLDGVRAVIRASDIPSDRRVWEKQPVLAGEQTRYTGEGLVLVAAETRAAASRALDAIRVEWEELPGIYDLETARRGPERFHPERETNEIEDSAWKVRRQDATEQGGPLLVIEREYRTRFVEHMYIEPEAVQVTPLGEGMHVVASAQSSFLVQAAVAHVLGVGMHRVQVCQPFVGGSFGGKNEGVAMLAAWAALLAEKTGRPVRMTLSREESMRISSKRHPMVFWYRAEVTESGKLQGMDARIDSEGGAYAVQTPYVNWRACVHACGPYDVPRVCVDTRGYYTNRPMSGAFRGFSSPQVIFAQESFMDEIADALGQDPLEFRLRNVLTSDSRTITGQDAGPLRLPLSTMLREAGKHTGFSRVRKEFHTHNRAMPRMRRGVGLALSYRGCGFGAETADATGVFLTLHKDGTVSLRMGLVDMGQGLHTAFAQLAAEALGVPLHAVSVVPVDTAAIPDGNYTSASRGTFTGGKAVVGAARALRGRLISYAASLWKIPESSVRMEAGRLFPAKEPGNVTELKDLARRAFFDGLDMGSWFWQPAEGVFWDEEEGRGDAYRAFSCSVVVTRLQVDTQTGIVFVDSVYTLHDAGTIVNPTLARSQVSGGILMGIGMALREEVQVQHGEIQNPGFRDYMLATTLDMPNMDIRFLEHEGNDGPYGAKSLGESSCEAVAASVSNAVGMALGSRFRVLPIRETDILCR